jgi:TolB-like protein
MKPLLAPLYLAAVLAALPVGAQTTAPATSGPLPAANGFKAHIQGLANQLVGNADPKSEEAFYLVGSFLNLNDLSETSPLGRLIAESLIHELQVRSWRIFEPRLMQHVMINPSGEFALSRDAKQLRESFGISGVITGTFAATGPHMVINARVINTQTGLVVSSAHMQIPASEFTHRMAAEPRASQQPMRIVGAPQ